MKPNILIKSNKAELRLRQREIEGRKIFLRFVWPFFRLFSGSNQSLKLSLITQLRLRLLYSPFGFLTQVNWKSILLGHKAYCILKTMQFLILRQLSVINLIRIWQKMFPEVVINKQILMRSFWCIFRNHYLLLRLCPCQIF